MKPYSERGIVNNTSEIYGLTRTALCPIMMFDTRRYMLSHTLEHHNGEGAYALQKGLINMRRKKRFFHLSPSHQAELNKFGIIPIYKIFTHHRNKYVPEFRMGLLQMQLKHLDGRDFLICSRIEDLIMARLNDYTIVPLKLQGDEKKRFTEWLKDTEFTPYDVWDELCGRGYKVSVSWIDKNNSFCVSVTGKDEASKNRRQTITSWSDDVTEALMMSLYKCLVMCEDNDWSAYATSSEVWG